MASNLKYLFTHMYHSYFLPAFDMECTREFAWKSGLGFNKTFT
jgi:hypothetical protein